MTKSVRIKPLHKIGQICMQGFFFWEALKAIISIAANHKETLGADAGKIGLMKKSMYGTEDAASNWERY